MVEGVSNLQENCTLKHIRDSISTDGIKVSRHGGNRGGEQRLKSAADPMEDSVTDEKRSLYVARCHLSKFSKPINHVETTIRDGAELHDLGL